MRVSDIGAWVECELRALQDPPRQSREHIAAWVGTLAHASLAGIQPPAPPLRFRFDSLTTTANQGTIQAGSIAEYARSLLYDAGLGVLDTEMQVRAGSIEGGLDLLVWDREKGQRGVIDLKTGQLPGAAWLQVGGYLTGVGDATFGGVLHVPRVGIGKRQTGRLEIRDGEDLESAWKVRVGRIEKVLNGAMALPSPGIHCGRCRVSGCPVRVGV